MNGNDSNINQKKQKYNRQKWRPQRFHVQLRTAGTNMRPSKLIPWKYFLTCVKQCPCFRVCNFDVRFAPKKTIYQLYPICICLLQNSPCKSELQGTGFIPRADSQKCFPTSLNTPPWGHGMPIWCAAGYHPHYAH